MTYSRSCSSEEEKKKQEPDDSCFSDDDLWFSEVCSSTECTGLIPARPCTEDGREFYEELYHPGIPESLQDYL